MSLYQLSLFQMGKGNNTKKAHWLLPVLLMLSCLFAQCAVHAQNQLQISQMATSPHSSAKMQGMHHDGGAMDMSQSEEHDCCEPKADCCEKPELLSNSFPVDHNHASLITTFSGLTGLLVGVPEPVDFKVISAAVPTGPPLHLIHCRFTI